jgi:hypothetical protein
MWSDLHINEAGKTAIRLANYQTLEGDNVSKKLYQSTRFPVGLLISMDCVMFPNGNICCSNVVRMTHQPGGLIPTNGIQETINHDNTENILMSELGTFETSP